MEEGTPVRPVSQFKLSDSMKSLSTDESNLNDGGSVENLTDLGLSNLSYSKPYKNDSASEDESENEYELLRRKNIEERNKFLQNLGINNAINSLMVNTQTPQSAKRKLRLVHCLCACARCRRRVAEPLPKREPSRRIRGLVAKKESEISTQEQIVSEEEVDNRLEGTVSLQLEEDSLNLIQNLQFLKEDCTYDPSLDISSCSSESFRNNLTCLQMVELRKVTQKRIQSICVHPTVTKQLVLAGCVTGTLGLWDLNANVDTDVVEFSYHNAPLNCISVSQMNQYKIYTTSHEGSVCCVDIENKLCSNIFSTDSTQRTKHLTWHHEIGQNRLLISHGNGSVGILDLREDNTKNISWIDCFDRSCRTVQLHPLDSNYFLASSGITGCKIFDLRSKQCISELVHPKGLTSAFFSPKGNEILTTCNDDRLRIFDCSSFKETLPRQKTVVVHNNHTGRWLSVFKAVWFPFRNDTFIIGSLLSPRRMEVYENTGAILYKFFNEDMLTISPVIAVHPKLPIVVGGNSSGKVHAFVPPPSTGTGE